MKKKLLIIIFISVYCNIYSADVSGRVYLDNDTNHANIKITFSPISPSAVFKESFSNMDGTFNTTLENGVYSIIYSKDGYLEYVIDEILLNGVVSLDDVVLSSNTLIEVSGAVEGNWTNNNTYKVVGDITIASNQSLSIEEGTEIKFDGYYSFIVEGTLIANGNENEPIVFTSNNGETTTDYWNQMIINSNNTTSIINHCIIEYAKRSDDNFAGVIEVNGSATLSNNTIRNTEETGISINSSKDVIILNNKVYNAKLGILVKGVGNITIENNEVYNISTIGIANNFEESIAEISNNKVYDCNLYGIQITGSINVTNNLIYNINNFSNSSGIFVNGYQPTLQNNTLVLNSNGISLYDGISFNPNPIINSNIIAYNTGYGIYALGEPKPAEVKYNLFFENNSGTGNNLPTGVGTITTTNINGTDADPFYNIFSDPELSSLSSSDDIFCELNSDSPAINAGDPNFQDQDSSIIDIGAKSFQNILSTSDLDYLNSEKNVLNVFPNPVKENLNFESSLGFNTIEIYDASGKTVLSFNFKNNIHAYTMIVSSIPKGLYLYCVKSNNNLLKFGKLIKQ